MIHNLGPMHERVNAGQDSAADFDTEFGRSAVVSAAMRGHTTTLRMLHAGICSVAEPALAMLAAQFPNRSLHDSMFACSQEYGLGHPLRNFIRKRCEEAPPFQFALAPPRAAPIDRTCSIWITVLHGTFGSNCETSESRSLKESLPSSSAFPPPPGATATLSGHPGIEDFYASCKTCTSSAIFRPSFSTVMGVSPP